MRTAAGSALMIRQTGNTDDRGGGQAPAFGCHPFKKEEKVQEQEGALQIVMPIEKPQGFILSGTTPAPPFTAAATNCGNTQALIVRLPQKTGIWPCWSGL